MDCVYINLADRTDRRDALERNFADVAGEGWSLRRFEAVSAQDVIGAGVSGILSAPEKGCFLSHNRLIGSIAGGGPVMIVEDDVRFGALSCTGIDTALCSVNEDAWDIVFTDVSVGNAGVWPDLIRLRRQFERTGTFQLVDVGPLQFAGSTSYILNGRSRALLSAMIDEGASIDLPYDIYLRRLIHVCQLKAFVIVPFATSISDLAGRSSIQPDQGGSADGISTLFRRLIWAERDLSAHTGEIEALRVHSDAETRIFAVLFEALMSEGLKR